MNFRIPCLKDVFAFLLLSMPLGTGVNLTYFIRSVFRSRKLAADYLGMIISYTAVLAAAAVLGSFHPGSLVLASKPVYYVLSPFAGVAALILEYIAGAVMFLAVNGKWPEGISVHPVYSGREKIGPLDILAAGSFVITEELVFRSAIMEILMSSGAAAITAAAVSAAVFAMNHIHWGIESFLCKLLSGFLYSIVYLLSGFCILIPAAAHMTQNCILLIAAGKMRKEPER